MSYVFQLLCSIIAIVIFITFFSPKENFKSNRDRDLRIEEWFRNTSEISFDKFMRDIDNVNVVDYERGRKLYM